MKHLKTFGILMLILLMSLTSCNKNKGNDGNKDDGKTPEVGTNLDEVDTAYWMSIDEAIKKASKSNIKEVLIEAKKYMNI